MKHKAFYLILSLLIFSFSFGQERTTDKDLFRAVVTKLKQDEKSLELFSDLYQQYLLDLSEEGQKEHFSDLYIRLYNEGAPLVRLLKMESFSKTFSQRTKRGETDKTVRLDKAFLKLTRNRKNYRTAIDIGEQEGQKEYFLKFLKEYKIVPATH